MRFNILNFFLLSALPRSRFGEEKSRCHLAQWSEAIARERKISIYRQLRNRKREKLNN
jgi:hypothetical protein